MPEGQSPAAARGRDPEPDFARFHGDLQAEYTKLVDIVSAFDQRLLIIKGWGVTLSLASLGLGFQQNHFGLFLVAAASGLAFWLLEATTKTHQMRYYPRMGDLEVFAYELFRVPVEGREVSSPLIDWSWHVSGRRSRGMKPNSEQPTSDRRPRLLDEPQRWADPGGDHAADTPLPPWLFPQVAMPHAVSVVLGAVLFLLGLLGVFGPI